MRTCCQAHSSLPLWAQSHQKRRWRRALKEEKQGAGPSNPGRAWLSNHRATQRQARPAFAILPGSLQPSLISHTARNGLCPSRSFLPCLIVLSFCPRLLRILSGSEKMCYVIILATVHSLALVSQRMQTPELCPARPSTLRLRRLRKSGGS